MTRPALLQSHPHADLVRVGENAVRITGRTGDAEKDWRLAHAVSAQLHSRESVTYVSAVPTYESVLIEFDATTTDLGEVLEDLEDVLDHVHLDLPLRPQPRTFQVPVLYGDDDPENPYGPDMSRVMKITGLGAQEIIARHSESTYTIRCLGAPGGSPMVYGPDLGVPIPRLRSPRTRVPQGAVSLAGLQATIAPTVAPGGWSVIGRTPLQQLDLDDEHLVPYQPGDFLSFHPIDADAFLELEGRRMEAEVLP